MSAHPYPIVVGLVLPVGVLFCGALVLFCSRRDAASLFQLAGAASMLIVVLAHIAEGFGVFPWMGWGQHHSVGHYVDFACAALASTLFPLGYLLHTVRIRHHLDEVPRHHH